MAPKKHHRACIFRAKLDVETLVCNRGRDFPLGRLANAFGARDADAGGCR